MGPAYALQWTLQASAVMLIQLVSLWRILPLNRREDGSQPDLLPRFGPGTLLTLIRSTIIALLSGFLLQGELPGLWAWLPAGLYILSDVTDFFDGFLARATNTATRLGETLDMNHDALGVLVVTVLAFQFGAVPWWYLPFGFARYIFMLGLYFHQRKGRPIHPLKPNHTRRLFAGLQMGFITVMLFPVIGPPISTFAATLFLFPFLTMFLVDYLQVTGEWDRYAFWQGWNLEPLRILLLDWTPLIMRGLIVLIYGKHARTFGLTALPEVSPMPEAARPIFLGLASLFIILFALGILSRAAAVGALVAAGIQLNWLDFSPDYRLLVFALVYILFVGSGKYTLWNPEEWLITNRAGQKKPS